LGLNKGRSHAHFAVRIHTTKKHLSGFDLRGGYQRFALAGTDDRSTREMAPREQAARQMPQP
jgi:hypothetical protein